MDRTGLYLESTILTRIHFGKTAHFSLLGATLLTLAVCITWNIGTSSAAKTAKKVPLDACFKTCASGIPKWHIYHRLCKPIILGHRGNPLLHQENTMEGFKSAYRQGASGFELDVFLTKDKKLVLFHDVNALVSNPPFQDKRCKRGSLLLSKTLRF